MNSEQRTAEPRIVLILEKITGVPVKEVLRDEDDTYNSIDSACCTTLELLEQFQ